MDLVKGVCPNERCKAVIPLISRVCPKCNAIFLGLASWKVLPLKPTEQCIAVTKAGVRCSNRAKASGVCAVHFPKTKEATKLPQVASEVTPNTMQFSLRENLSTSTNITEYKPSDIWLMKAWIYGVLPMLPLAILYVSFFIKNAVGSLNDDQFFFVAITAALIFGLHKKHKWAWYLNWIAVLGATGIAFQFCMREFGALGGGLCGLWMSWNFVVWKRLKSNFP